MSTPETKRCSRCGDTLSCGAKLDSCWCQQLPALPAALLSPTSDCYCPRCLEMLTKPLEESAAHVV